MSSFPSSYTLSRYLTAKQTVDERALNRRVEERFYAELARQAEGEEALTIVDLGAGLGPTARRVIRAVEDERVAPSVRSIVYHLVDQSPQLMAEARANVQDWMSERDYEVDERTGELICSRGERAVVFCFHATGAAPFLRTELTEKANAVIAQSFLDLVNVAQTLKHIRQNTTPGALLYFPLTFDGTTRFLPTPSPTVSERIVNYYHESMQRETPHGPTSGAETGRALLETLPGIGSFLEVGSSDWLVYPQANGTYKGAEAYFLHHILHFVEEELEADDRLPSDDLSDWIAHCRNAVEEGRLIYQASQLDVLARVHP
jgi:hypothetical protein